MNELYWKPAHELAAMMRKREIKPSELMDVTIRRIEATNPKLNAFVALPCQIIRAGGRLIYRLLSWNPWQRTFFRTLAQLRC